MTDLHDTYEGLIYAELHGEGVTATRRVIYDVPASRSMSGKKSRAWGSGWPPKSRPASCRGGGPIRWNVTAEPHLTLHPQQWADLLAATAASPVQRSDWRPPTDAATVDTSLLRASTAFPARSPSLRDHPGEAPHRVKRK